MKSAQSPCRILERVEQGDEEADALEVGATGDALVGAVDAAVAFVIVDHKGGEADALVANALVVGGIGCTNHGRGHDAKEAITPPFFTWSFNMASAAVVPGAPTRSRPISSRI